MSNSSFYSTTGATSNQEDAIEASVNNAAASETAAAASSATSTAQATISTDKATESAASAAEALVSKNAAAGSSSSALTSKNSATSSASAASGSATSASSSASTATSQASASSLSAAASLVSKNQSLAASQLSQYARDDSIDAKNLAVQEKILSVNAKTSSEAARDLSIAAKNDSVTAKDASVVAKDAAAASAASALSNKNSTDTNSSTATTKASEAASSATASASSATASAASATTSTASKDTAVAVTANFLGAHSSAPTQTAAGGSLAVGMLYFDTGSDVLKVRASGGWINAGSSINGTSARFAYTLSANQTTVSGNDLSGNSLQFDAPFVDVFLNGVKLAAGDMNISSGTSVVLAAGATAGDILEVVAFGTFQLTNGVFAGTTTVNNLTITGTTTAPTQAESDDSTKIATTAYVVDKITTLIGGAPSTLSDLNELAAAINDDANYNSTLTTALATKLPLAGGAITGDVTFGDGNKAIFGAGSDLKIYHSGSSSIIDNTSGGLFFNQWVDNADITFQNDDSTGGTTTYMLMQGSTGEVQLKHYGSTKISTKAAGVEVAGNMVVSGTVDGVDIAARDAVLTSTTTVANAALPKAGGTVTGDVTFNTQLGLGVAPHATASLNITNTNQHIRLNNGSELGVIALLSSGELELWGHGANESINFRTGSGSGNIAMNIVGNNVGINNASPSAKLHIGAETEVNLTAQSLFVQGSKSAFAGYAGLPQGQLLVYDDTASTAGSGGAIGFGANTGSTQKTWIAAIDARRDSATNNDYGGSLSFYTRPTGGVPVERMRLSSAGIVTTPYQPRFKAYLNANTGATTFAASTVHRVPFASEHWDVGNNFNTSDYMFHAPVDGIYLFNVAVLLHSVSTGTSNCEISFRHENHATYYGSRVDASTGWGDSYVSLNATAHIKLDAGDTVSVKVYCTEAFGIYGNSSGASTYFSGVLEG